MIEFRGGACEDRPRRLAAAAHAGRLKRYPKREANNGTVTAQNAYDVTSLYRSVGLWRHEPVALSEPLSVRGARG